jgi:hypothetical protein
MHNIMNVDGLCLAVKKTGSENSWHRLEHDGEYADYLKIAGEFGIETVPGVAIVRGREIETGKHDVFITHGDTVWPAMTVKNPDHVVSPHAVFSAFENLAAHFSFGTVLGTDKRGPGYFTVAMDMGEFSLFDDPMEKHTSHLAVVVGFVQGQHTVWFMETNTRVVCQNTLNIAMGNNSLLMPLTGANKLDWAHYASNVWEAALKQRTNTIANMERAWEYETHRDEFLGLAEAFFTPKEPAVMALVRAGDSVGVQMSASQGANWQKASARYQTDLKRAQNSVAALGELYKNHTRYMPPGGAALNAATWFDTYGHDLARKNKLQEDRLLGDLVDRAKSFGATWLEHACGDGGLKTA